MDETSSTHAMLAELAHENEMLLHTLEMKELEVAQLKKRLQLQEEEKEGTDVSHANTQRGLNGSTAARTSSTDSNGQHRPPQEASASAAAATAAAAAAAASNEEALRKLSKQLQKMEQKLEHLLQQDSSTRTAQVNTVSANRRAKELETQVRVLQQKLGQSDSQLETVDGSYGELSAQRDKLQADFGALAAGQKASREEYNELIQQFFDVYEKIDEDRRSQIYGQELRIGDLQALVSQLKKDKEVLLAQRGATTTATATATPSAAAASPSVATSPFVASGAQQPNTARGLPGSTGFNLFGRPGKPDDASTPRDVHQVTIHRDASNGERTTVVATPRGMTPRQSAGQPKVVRCPRCTLRNEEGAVQCAACTYYLK